MFYMLPEAIFVVLHTSPCSGIDPKSVVVLTVSSLATGSVGDGSEPGALRVRDHRLPAGVWTAPLSPQPACAAFADPTAFL